MIESLSRSDAFILPLVERESPSRPENPQKGPVPVFDRKTTETEWKFLVKRAHQLPDNKLDIIVLDQVKFGASAISDITGRTGVAESDIWNMERDFPGVFIITHKERRYGAGNNRAIFSATINHLETD